MLHGLYCLHLIYCSSFQTNKQIAKRKVREKNKRKNPQRMQRSRSPIALPDRRRSQQSPGARRNRSPVRRNRSPERRNRSPARRGRGWR